MNRRVEIDLSVRLRSPFLMQGLAAGRLGLDATALRDEEGRPLVPADQVKGLLRAACFTLSQATNGRLVDQDAIDALFGAESPKRGTTGSGEQDAPNRGALIVGDLAGPAKLGASTATRVHIDPATGAARTGHLQIVELAAPLGTEVTFTGTVIARLGHKRAAPPGEPDEAAWLARLLDKAVKLVPAMGALKSAGFGQVVSGTAVLQPAKTRDLALPQPRPAAADQCTYRVTFDRRILVDSERVADNVWCGSAVVPGTVFKGALADRLARAGVDPTTDPAFGRALATIRIGHAFPADKDGALQELPPPLSLFLSGTGKPVADGLYGGKPELAPRLGGEAPRFRCDWKDEDTGTVRRRLDWSTEDPPAKLPRGHVEIGRDYVAADGRLFVDAARSHRIEFASGDWRCRNWHLALHRNGADADIFSRILAILEEEGLDGIGSTGAHACFHTDGHVARPGRVAEVVPGSRLWAVTLVTPALILDPRDFLPEDGPPPDPFAAYADYWRTAVAGATLVNFFASQRLTGGYIAVRHRPYGPMYYPFLLTDPGSVFLLHGDLASALAGRVAGGLPVKELTTPEGAVIEPTWRTCPYMPENGYGEIAVNLIDHATLAAGVTHD